MLRAYVFIEQKLLPNSDPYNLFSLAWTTIITACTGVALGGWLGWMF